MNLIDADELKQSIQEIHKSHGLSKDEEMEFTETDIYGLLETAQEVNTIEIVRCMDCKFYDIQTFLCERPITLQGEYGYVPLDIEMPPNEFCSYGKRIEGVQNNAD